MIEGINNQISATPRPSPRGSVSQTDETQHKKEGSGDAVELSATARQQIERPESTEIRKELVERVRAEIAADTYLTDDKIDAVVNRLMRKVIAAA